MLNEYKNYQVLIFTTDEKSSNFQTKYFLFFDISTIHNSHKLGIVKTFNNLSLLVKNGIGFIHSDLDAVWLSDPKEYLNDNLSIISQGTDLAHESYMKIIL